MEHSTKQKGDWGEHWVALRLLEQGWQIKFLGDAVPSYDMIAYHRDHGARTVQVKTIGKNTGAIELGPRETFTADVLLFVVNPMTPEAAAYVYHGESVRTARNIDTATGPFVTDRNGSKRTGMVHVWTRRNTKVAEFFPTVENREAWYLVASAR
jgi:hypothetical protein